jgi:hypothetical protein
MMAINHAVMGALIGLTFDEPAAALPLAFLSHFALDAVPHYDSEAKSKDERLASIEFFQVQILLNGLLCFLLVIVLASTQPKNWLQAAICAFLGASPDFMWIPRYLAVRRTGRIPKTNNWLLRFHGNIQWLTGPRLLWMELIWLAATGGVLTSLMV